LGNFFAGEGSWCDLEPTVGENVKLVSITRHVLEWVRSLWIVPLWLMNCWEIVWEIHVERSSLAGRGFHCVNLV